MSTLVIASIRATYTLICCQCTFSSTKNYWGKERVDKRKVLLVLGPLQREDNVCCIAKPGKGFVAAQKTQQSEDIGDYEVYSTHQQRKHVPH